MSENQGEKITAWTEDKLASLVGMNLPTKETKIQSQDENALVPLGEPELNSEDFTKSLFEEAPTEKATKGGMSSNPYAKFTAVALPLGAIFLVGGILYQLVTGGFGSDKKPEIAATPTPTPTPTVTTDAETGNLKTEVALGTQAQQINALTEAREKEKQNPLDKTSKAGIQTQPLAAPTPASSLNRTSTSTVENNKIEPRISPSVRREVEKPAYLTARPRQLPPPPEPVVERSYRPRYIAQAAASPISQQPRPTYMVSRKVPSSNVSRKPKIQQNPLPKVYPVIPPRRQNNNTRPGNEDLASLLPRSNASTAFQGTPSYSEVSVRRTISYGAITYEQPKSNNTSQNYNSANHSSKNLAYVNATSDDQEKNNLLQETPVMNFQVGSSAAGKLSTPVFYLEQKNGNNGATNELDSLTYSLKLTESLKGANEEIVIPSGSLIILKASAIDKSGLANLKVLAFIYNNREYNLPVDYLSVRGNKNKPLLANKINTGDNYTGAEIKEAIIASLAKVGDVLTRPDSTSTISNGSVTSTETSGGKDILGAVLSGGLNTILKRETDKTNRVIEANISRPQLWYLSQDTKVSLYVNKTFRL